MFTIIAQVFYVLIAAAMIALILMQRGAGADAGSGFGGGASATVFGARGSSNFLSRSTAVLAGLFFLLSLGMGMFHSRPMVVATSDDLGVMAGVAPKATTDDVPAAPATAPAATDVPTEYLPTLLFLIVATGIGIALIVIGNASSGRVARREKLSPYECGFEAVRGRAHAVRRALLPDRHPVHRLRPGNHLHLPWTLVFRSWVRGAGHHGPVRGHAVPRLRLRLEEGSARMGVIQPSTV
jgi:preprotein translocase subunit SecG